MTITISTHHTYRVDGIVKPSVTQIIKHAGMIDGQWFTPEATARGTEIHKMLEALDLGMDWPVAWGKKHAGFLNAYRMFKKWCQPVWDLDGIEQSFYCAEYDYCGTRDRVGGLVSGGTWVNCVIDLKTGIPCDWHAIQLAGYALPHRYEWERFSLYLRQDGTYRLIHHQDDSDFSTFKNILEAWHETNTRD